MRACADPDRGQGLQTPSLDNHKVIGFLSNTGPDRLENHKASKPAFNVRPPSARQRNAILMKSKCLISLNVFKNFLTQIVRNSAQKHF